MIPLSFYLLRQRSLLDHFLCVDRLRRGRLPIQPSSRHHRLVRSAQHVDYSNELCTLDILTTAGCQLLQSRDAAAKAHQPLQVGQLEEGQTEGLRRIFGLRSSLLAPLLVGLEGGLREERAVKVRHSARVLLNKLVELLEVKLSRDTRDAFVDPVECKNAEYELLGDSNALDKTRALSCIHTILEGLAELAEAPAEAEGDPLLDEEASEDVGVG